jgi:hypothetical protein
MSKKSKGKKGKKRNPFGKYHQTKIDQMLENAQAWKVRNMLQPRKRKQR